MYFMWAPFSFLPFQWQVGAERSFSTSRAKKFGSPEPDSETDFRERTGAGLPSHTHMSF
jgi:hypothetical protein